MSETMIRGHFETTNWTPDPKERKARRQNSVKDWHVKWKDDEPACAGNQWRQRDRYAVINMADMENRHLGHAIRFASTMQPHASRLGALLVERARRGST